jgi:hypothetical protein
VIDDQSAPPQRLSHDSRGIERMKSLAAVLQNPDQRAIVHSRDTITETEGSGAKTA